MRISSLWDVEDNFFGAIVGAFIGILIDKLLLEDVILIMLYIVLFPMTLRRASQMSKYAFITAIILSILWMMIYVYKLSQGNVVELEKGLMLVVIFIGWLVSISMRSIHNIK